ncbi:MAG: ATP-binding cassette domain-containing protein [Candidatus Cloacimonetes bacterium]|nr:ATP-binding cassette domain-containing protein [Candidatus Cloacimonadota bacterium]
MKVPIISVKKIVAKYGENTVLKDVTVDIFPNEITVILGGSGCGKTTFIKNILQLYKPFSGSIKIFGEETVGLFPEEFNKILEKIGMLFQNGALLNSVNIFDNVSIPLEQHTVLPAEIIEKIIKVKLNLVNLGHVINLFPSELSGGMKKRAALARAIALDPEILFCDEPSAGLDPITSENLDNLILKLKEQLNMTIIIVTHELASIHRIANRIIFLDEGEVLFQGTLAEAKNCGIQEVEHFFEVGKFGD